MPKKERQGIVVSNKMEKTVVVKVQDYKPHPKYKKFITFTKNYKAHDENNQCNEGDKVRIIECRPYSKDKCWNVAEIIERANAL